MVIRLIILFLIVSASAHADTITFEDFVASHGLTGADADHLADPDKDGLVNLMEYAFDGFDPSKSDRSAKMIPGWVERDGDERLQYGPFVSGQPPKDGHYYFAISWIPRPNTTGIRFEPEMSFSTGRAAPGEKASGLRRWASGRGNVANRLEADGSITSIYQGRANIRDRSFWRIRVIVDPTATDSAHPANMRGYPIFDND